jgi:hypothetical protein
MSTSHTDRAARMGYGGPVSAKPRAAAAPIKTLHGNPYDLQLANYFDRRESALRDDAEGLELARLERKQVENFARARGIAPEHLQEALAVMHEHDNFPKSKEAIETRRAQTIEKLRLEHGGSEAAHEHLQNYVNITNALAKEAPTLVERANRTGAGEDLRIINALSAYGAAPESGETSNG